MARVLMVDDSVPVAELVASTIGTRLGVDVQVIGSVGAITDEILAAGVDVAVVDLSFADQQRNGIDALLRFRSASPETKLMLYTQGDRAVYDLLSDAWQLFPIASAWSKSAPLDALVDAIQRVLRDGSAPNDPVLQPLLPSERSPWRTLEGYKRLVQHAGHAKLWLALIEVTGEPTYRVLSLATGLKVTTLKNYRSDLVPELWLHGVNDPTMREMQVWAQRSRPFLEPYVRAALDRGVRKADG